MDEKTKITITCAPGLTDVLEGELQSFGFQVDEKKYNSVNIQGTLKDCYLLNYVLRTANRVLYKLFQTGATHPDHLYKKAKAYPWEDLIYKGSYISIDSFVRNKFIKDTRFANLRLKDAIADRFMDLYKLRPDSGPRKDDIVLFLYWIEKEAEIYLDTSGETISKHGYRSKTTGAPLQENLAAALIYSSKWDQNSHFINPMCGSGTLAIEAAMMVIKKYPGTIRRNYCFQKTSNYNRNNFQEIESGYRPKSIDKLPFKIIATDYNRIALETAKNNARKAGVDHLIQFQKCDFKLTTVPPGNGVVMLNPEYGERLGSEKDLERHYSEIGDFLKQNCTGKTGYVFTGNLQASKSIGLRTTSKNIFYNGKIECRLLEYEIF